MNGREQQDRELMRIYATGWLSTVRLLATCNTEQTRHKLACCAARQLNQAIYWRQAAEWCMVCNLCGGMNVKFIPPIPKT